VDIAGLSPGRVSCNRADLLLADGVSYDRFRQPDYKAFQPAVLFLENVKLLLQFCVSRELIVRQAPPALNPLHNSPFSRFVNLVALSIARTQKLVAHPAMNAVFALKVFDQIIGGESMRIRVAGRPDRTLTVA
jgi:hypothetical protein